MSFTWQTPTGFDPCGAVFGAVRKPYTAPAKSFRDQADRTNRIIWYLAPEGALIYEEPHVFNPGIDRADDPPNGLYEFTALRTNERRYHNGLNIYGTDGLHWHGDAEDFLGRSSVAKYGLHPANPCHADRRSLARFLVRSRVYVVRAVITSQSRVLVRGVAEQPDASVVSRFRFGGVATPAIPAPGGKFKVAGLALPLPPAEMVGGVLLQGIAGDAPAAELVNAFLLRAEAKPPAEAVTEGTVFLRGVAPPAELVDLAGTAIESKFLFSGVAGNVQPPGAVGLTILNIPSDVVGVPGSAVAEGDISLTAPIPAVGGVVLGGSIAAASGAGLTASIPAAGDLGLSAQDTPVVPPSTAGGLGLASLATAAGAVGVSRLEVPDGAAWPADSNIAAGGVGVSTVDSASGGTGLAAVASEYAESLVLSGPGAIPLPPAAGGVGLTAEDAAAGSVGVGGPGAAAGGVGGGGPGAAAGGVSLPGSNAAAAGIELAVPDLAAGDIWLTTADAASGALAAADLQSAAGAAGLNRPHDPRCVYDSDECPGGVSAVWRFTVAGITDNSCTVCDDWNGDFTLRLTSGIFGVTDEVTDGCSPTFERPAWFMDVNAGLVRLFQAAGDHQFYYTIPVDDFDCNGPNVLTFSGGLTTFCLNPPATITITPDADCIP